MPAFDTCLKNLFFYGLIRPRDVWYNRRAIGVSY
jgi:hypothetical protein